MFKDYYRPSQIYAICPGFALRSPVTCLFSLRIFDGCHVEGKLQVLQLLSLALLSPLLSPRYRLGGIISHIDYTMAFLGQHGAFVLVGEHLQNHYGIMCADIQIEFTFN